MSKEKAAAIAALSPPDRAAYQVKRNIRAIWRRLDRDEWAAFCHIMATWFDVDAPDEFDEQLAANQARKAASDKAALERVQLARAEARAQ